MTKVKGDKEHPITMYHHYMNYGEQLVASSGESKSDLWIWTQLVERLGFEEEFTFTRSQFLEMGLTHLNKHGMTLERLKGEKRLSLPVSYVPWDSKEFLTPSGKFEFTSSMAEDKGYNKGKPTYLPPKESRITNPSLAEKYPYQLLSSVTIKSFTALYPP